MEVGVKESKKKYGHAERMGDEKLAKTADAQKVEGKRVERGLKLRWRLLRRDLKKMQQIEGIGDCC